MADNRIFDEIRKSVDIVDIIGNYVSLSRCGKSYKGLCPFHSDAHPSMMVSPEKQIYRCFSCGASGNVFTFVQNIEKLSFIEAVKKVCLLGGVKLPSELESKTISKPVSKYDSLYKLMNDLANFYSYQINVDLNSDANKYLDSRNLSDEDRRTFRIGYCPESGFESIEFLRNKGYKDDEIISCGVASDLGNGKLIDRLRGRVIFSICDKDGNVVAFSGRRIMDGLGEKYVNSPETVIFHKSNVLYNYHQAILNSRKDGYCYIVEGFMDAIALCKAGIRNVVATMGTAFTNEHISLLKQLKCELRLLFDADSAGQIANNKCIDSLINSGIAQQIVVPFNSAKDVDELLQTKGKEEVIKLVNKLESIPQYKINYLASLTNFMNHEETKKFVSDCSSFLCTLDLDEMDIDYYAEEISKKSGISKQLVIKQLNKVKKEKTSKEEYDYYSYDDTKIPSETVMKALDKYTQSDHQILQMMIKSPIHIAEYRSLGISLTSKECRQLANIIVDKYNKNEEISIASLFSDVPSELTKLLGDLDREVYPDIEMKELSKIVGDKFLDKLTVDDLKKQIEDEDDYEKQLEMANKLLEMIKKDTKNEG